MVGIAVLRNHSLYESNLLSRYAKGDVQKQGSNCGMHDCLNMNRRRIYAMGPHSICRGWVLNLFNMMDGLQLQGKSCRRPKQPCWSGTGRIITRAWLVHQANCITARTPGTILQGLAEAFSQGPKQPIHALRILTTSDIDPK